MLNKIQRKRRIKLAKGKPNIKVGSFWIRNIFIVLIIFSFSIFFAYKVFNGDEAVNYLLKINNLRNNNSAMQDELDTVNLKYQMLEVAISKKDEELKKLKEENNELQEEVLFYEKIVGKRR